MKLMGRHSPPVNGTVIANGHAPAVTRFTPLPLQVRGDMSGWPQQPAIEPDVKGERWQRIKSGFRVVFAHRGWLAAVPVVLVNTVAFGAQLGFWNAHLPAVADAVLVALALESIAVYLAWQAHLAQLADDSALRLRFSAYAMALVIGALNYSHFDGPGWRPTVPAVTFGMMSAISPWLWSVHSRRVSRDALKAKGLIEPHAVRLGGTRWGWHAWRSAWVMYHATWAGETDPVKAIVMWEPRKARKALRATSPEPPAAVSPVVAEGRQEDISDEDEAAPAVPSPDVVKRVRPKARKRTAPPSARARAVALLKAEPGIADVEVVKRLKVSKSTVERARAEFAKGAP